MAEIGITGGRGFVGSELVRAHVERGDRVRLLSRSVDAGRVDADVFTTDLADPDMSVLRDFATGCDVVYHAAAQLSGSAVEIDRTNVEGTAALLDAIDGSGVRFVQLSSVGTYGDVVCGTHDETLVPAPTDAYERSKLNADRQVVAVTDSGRLDAALVQPSLVVGPGMSSNILRNLAALSRRGFPLPWCAPDAILNVVALSDLVDALLLASTSPATGSFIVSSPIRWTEIFDRFEALEPRRRPDAQGRLGRLTTQAAVTVASLLPPIPISARTFRRLRSTASFSSAKAHAELGWRAAVSPSDAVLSAVT